MYTHSYKCLADLLLDNTDLNSPNYTEVIIVILLAHCYKVSHKSKYSNRAVDHSTLNTYVHIINIILQCVLYMCLE